MKVDFSQGFKNIEGEEIKDSVVGTPLTLKIICQQALLGSYPKEDIDGAEKARRWQLATVLKDGVVDHVTVEEVALMKKLIGMAYAPMIVGQAYGMLDG